MTGEPYVIVSTDSHIGPGVEAYREYCEPRYRDDYEDFVRFVNRPFTDANPGREGQKPAKMNDLAARHAADEGINDPYERLKNMDADGVTSESIFHGTGSQHGQRGVQPFYSVFKDSLAGEGHSGQGPSWSVEHSTSGKRMYNRWLADFCSVAPDRLIGVAELPFWDLDATVAELEFVIGLGFKAVNLATPRPHWKTYADPSWDRFFAVASEAGISLNCHAGVPIHDFTGTGSAFLALFRSEIHYLARTAFTMLAFGGVLERHPNLRVCFNEGRGYWVDQFLADLDAIYLNPDSEVLRSEVPHLPSEYWLRHGFVGASFIAHFELDRPSPAAVATTTWGRDYPHVEGTWPHTREALRTAFWDLPEEPTRRILGENGARLYGLDMDKLTAIAADIGPTPEELSRPLEATPPDAYGWAFRDRADAHGGARTGAY